MEIKQYRIVLCHNAKLTSSAGEREDFVYNSIFKEYFLSNL